MRLPTNPATTLWRSLRDEVRQHYPAGRVIVAVDGGTDAPAFADGLAEAFAEEGATVFRASMDDFRRPRTERLAQGSTPAGFYRDTYDDLTLRRVLIEPFRTGEGAGFQLTAFDAARDMPVEPQWVTAPRDAVLVVDGPFLLRPELRGLWNWSVRLETPPVPASTTGIEPDEPDEPWRDAHELYVREAEPRASASAIVDSSDPARPVRIFGDFC